MRLWRSRAAVRRDHRVRALTFSENGLVIGMSRDRLGWQFHWTGYSDNRVTLGSYRRESEGWRRKHYFLIVQLGRLQAWLDLWRL